MEASRGKRFCGNATARTSYGELPVGLKQFRSYYDKGLDRNSDEARAIQATGFPPDLVENGTSLGP